MDSATLSGRPPTVAAVRRLLGRIDPSRIVWLTAAVVLTWLVLGPVGWLVTSSLQSPTGSWIDNYTAAFGSARFRTSFTNSMIVGLIAGLISVVLGAPTAWAVVRTNMPFRRLIRTLVIGSFAIPAFIGAMAWVLLAGPNAGTLNSIAKALTGDILSPFNVFTLMGMTIVIALYSYPFVFLFTSSALELMGSEVEDAANILGAGVVRTALTITLPLAMPAILAGFIMAFLEAIALFGTPAMLGMPVGVRVMTTEIYSIFTSFPPRVGVAAAMAMPLLLLTAVLLTMQRRILGRRSYATLTGKGDALRIIPLGPWRWPTFLLCLLVVSCSALLPISVLLGASLSSAWGVGLTPSNLTLGNYHFIFFEFSAGRLAITNSLQLAAMAATAAVLLSLVLAYVVGRRLVPAYQVLAFLASVPFVIPGVVLAVGLFAAYTKPPFMLYGSLWILFAAYLTKYLPLAFNSVLSSISRLHPELEDAAMILGASRLRALRDVVLPLMKVSLVGGWLLVFMPALRELSASILLFTSKTMVIPVLIFNLYGEGKWEVVSALGVFILAIAFGVIMVGYRLLGRNFMGSGG